MLRLPQVNSGFPLTRLAELPYLLVTLFPQKLPSSKHLFITCVLTVRQDIHTCLSWTARPMFWGFACCSESGPHRRCSASVHSRLRTKAPYCHSPVYSPSSHVVPATLALPVLWHLGCHRKETWQIQQRESSQPQLSRTPRNVRPSGGEPGASLRIREDHHSLSL